MNSCAMRRRASWKTLGEHTSIEYHVKHTHTQFTHMQSIDVFLASVSICSLTEYLFELSLSHRINLDQFGVL